MPKSLKHAIEAFSALTGVSFLLSCIIHQAIFAFWHVNFMTIATLEDIILHGISLLITFGLTVTLYSAGLGLLILYLPGKSQPHTRGWWLRATTGVILPLLNSLFLFYWLGVSKMATDKAYGVYLPISVTLGTVIAMGLIYALSAPGRLRAQLAVAVEENNLLFSAMLCVGGAILVSALQVSIGHLQLDLTDDSLAKACGTKPDIRWIGSRAMVVDCRGSRYVWFYAIDHPTLMRVAQK